MDKRIYARIVPYALIASGAMFVSLFLLVPNIYVISTGISLILGAFLFLHLNRCPSAQIPCSPHTAKHPKIVDSIIFFLLFLFICMYQTRSGYLEAAFVYSLIASVIVFKLLSSPQRGSGLALSLLQIGILSLIMRLVLFNVSSFPLGVDPWGHYMTIRQLRDVGFLEAAPLIAGTKNIVFSGFFIENQMLLEILDWPAKQVMFLAGSCIMLTSLTIYKVSQYFVESPGHALISVLIFLSCEYTILWGITVIPMSYGIALFIPLVLLLVKGLRGESFGTSLLFITMVLVLALTHPVASFIFVLVGLAYFIFSTGMKRGNVANLALLSAIIVISIWVYPLITEKYTFLEWITTTFVRTTEDVHFRNPSLPSDRAMFSWTGLIDVFPLMALTLGGVVGSLFLLNEEGKRGFAFAFIGSTAVLFFFTYVFPLFGLRNVLPTRWFAFIYVFLSVLFVAHIYNVGGKVRHLKNIYPVLMGALILMMMLGSTINHVEPLDYDLVGDRPNHVPDEEAFSCLFAGHYSDSTTIVDRRLTSLFGHYLGNRNYSVFKEGSLQSASDGTLFIHRSIFDDYYKTSESLGSMSCQYSKTYSSGGANLFILATNR